MPVIEGVGDEVLVVVGLFLLLCMVLLAWFSTHTRDIPFVSVIVVELSQRRQRNTNSGDNNAPSAEERADGHPTESVPSETGGPGGDAVAFNNNADTDGGEDSASAAASRNSMLEYMMSQCVANGGAKVSDSSCPSSAPEPDQPDATEEAVEGPDREEAEEEASTVPPFVPQHDSGEEVRRRRVAYFSGGLGQESNGVQKDGPVDAPPLGEFTTATSKDSAEASALRQAVTHKSGSGHSVSSSETLVSVSESRVASSTPPGASSSSQSMPGVPCSGETSRAETEAAPSQKTPPPPPSSPAVVAEGSPSGVADTTEGSVSGKSGAKVMGESLSGERGFLDRHGEGASASGRESGGAVPCDSEETSPDTSSQQIRVRLKYLNDTQRLVYTHPQETIGNFRRVHFSSELEENKIVRFIFNGQDLRNDLTTLHAYNIADNSVVHCLITQNQRTEAPTSASSAGQEEEVQMGVMLFPVFGVILGLVWYLRFMYKQYFNAMSTVSLAGISFIYLLAFFSSLRNRRQPHQHLE